MTENADTATRHRVLHLHERVLDRNRAQAERNRAFFREHGITAINILSAPGSGKTALLERTLADLRNELRAAVIVGDLATDSDARRLASTDAAIVQITTGTLCHLEAAMIARAYEELDPAKFDLLFIENVGNLVCPAAFDLGESLRVVLTAVTEGEDKPLKYPTLFKTANTIIVTKIDLAVPCGFDRASLRKNLADISPAADVVELSARTGAGLASWYERLRTLNHLAAARK
jgi:hydrogenase nickel incorporation protein HypB